MRSPSSLRLRLAGSGFLSSAGGCPVLASIGFLSHAMVAQIPLLHLVRRMWASPCAVSQVPVISCAFAGATAGPNVRSMVARKRNLVMRLPGGRVRYSYLLGVCGQPVPCQDRKFGDAAGQPGW